MKDMSNRQLFDEQKNKVKNQDKTVEDLVGYTKDGKKQANELSNELGKQNLLLGDVEKDVFILVIYID